MKSTFKFIKNIFVYALVATLLLSPLGWVLVVMFFYIEKSEWCKDTWLILDILACNLRHKTGINRTISGWTGQHLHLPRYKKQARLIDGYFGKNHCIIQFRYERKKGYVK